MTFLEDRFPRPPKLGYVSIPRYDVEITTDSAGGEERNRNWSRPLHEYSFTCAALDIDIGEIIEFYHAVGGRAYGFRFRDWNDYLSCRLGQTPTATDQPAVALTATTFQLVKDYTRGALTQRREIRKPVAGTILVAAGGVPQPSGWTLSASTGVITFDEAPSGAVTWGGEFDVPVRFDSDLPIDLNFRSEDGRYVQSVQFTLKELRRP
jgi:uncharacterized protein (TIGR02217 family)